MTPCCVSPVARVLIQDGLKIKFYCKFVFVFFPGMCLFQRKTHLNAVSQCFLTMICVSCQPVNFPELRKQSILFCLCVPFQKVCARMSGSGNQPQGTASGYNPNHLLAPPTKWVCWRSLQCWTGGIKTHTRSQNLYIYPHCRMCYSMFFILISIVI